MTIDTNLQWIASLFKNDDMFYWYPINLHNRSLFL